MSSPLPDAVPLGEIRRALVTKLRHHGDVLLASPGLHGAEARGAAGRDRRARLRAKPRRCSPITRRSPTIHTVDREWKRQGLARQAAAEWRLAARAARPALRSPRAPDRASARRVARHLLRPRYAVTRERNGRAPTWRCARSRISTRCPRTTPRHTVETNLDALRRIGVYPDDDDRRLVLVPGRRRGRERGRAARAARA